MGFVMDANLLNVAAMQMMSEYGDKPNYNLRGLTDTQISVRNPCFPNQQMYFFLCSTHQLKNTRNALQSSRKRGKRNFVSTTGHNFGWEYIKQQWECDKNRQTQLSSLSETAIHG